MNKVLDWTGLIRELLLYLSTFGMRLVMEPKGLYVIVLACICGWLCIMTQEKGKLRFLPLILCTGMFYLIPSISSAVIIVYLCVKCFMGKWEYDYDFTLTETLFMIPVFLIFALFTGFNSDYLRLGLPLFIAFLSLTMFDLRMLRSGRNDKDLSYTGMNALLCFGLGLIVLCMMLPSFTQLIVSILGFVYNKAILPVLQILAGIVGIITYAIVKVFLFLFSLINKEEAEMNEMEMGEFGEYLPENINMDSHPVLMVAAGMILLMLVVIVMYFLLKKMRKRAVDPNRHLTMQRERILSSDKKRRRDDAENAKIRKIYRKYLKLCEKQNIIIDGSIASDIIAKQTNEIVHNQDADRLRHLWLPVRYGKQEDAETEEAEQLVQNIKKSFQ